MRTKGREVWFAAATAAGLLGVHLAVGAALLRESAWTLLVAGACASVLLGVCRHRPAATGPWLVLAAGLGLLTAGNVANHPLWGNPAWTSTLGQLTELAAFPLIGLAALGMVRRQAPEGDREGAVDGTIVMVALFTVLSGTVFAANGPQATSSLGRVLIVVAPVLLAAVAASAARLMFAGTRVPSTYLLAGASACALGGHVVRTFAQAAGTYQRGSWDDVFIGMAYAGVGLAALHPSMQGLTEVRPPDDRRLTHTRLGILGASLVTPPLTLLLSGQADIVALLASVVVSVLVLWRLWRLVLEREVVRDEMRRRSIHDGLTGLPNRAHLLDRLDGSLRAGARSGAVTAVLFIDLDGFKQVNDDFGHRSGDEALLAVVERLRGLVRDQDLLGRLAGDEFVVVCEDVDVAAVTSLAERVRGAFADPFRIHAATITLGASIGVAVGSDGATPEQLLHEADAAMYHGKQRGGGSIEVFDEELGTRLLRRRQLEADLPVALEQGSLELVYQPIVALAERPGAPSPTAGVEALLRWAHPQLGVVGPAELVSIADASGFIVDLGAWVLEEACWQLDRWRAAGVLPVGLRVFVNCSSRQLLHAELPQQIQSILTRTGVAPQEIVLEVTETAVLDDDGLAVRNCRALRGRGVAIALDDFGTGYSSLTHLKRFPLDLIKIDASFVADLWRSGDDQAIVSAIVAIARQLGAEVVGEGVESAEQHEVLRRLGCDYAQGYHLGAPQGADELGWGGAAPPTDQSSTSRRVTRRRVRARNTAV